jgi:hypothetical protein
VTGRLTCARCTQPATHIVEAGVPGRVGCRGAVTCGMHLAEVRRWAAGGGGVVVERALDEGEPSTLF